MVLRERQKSRLSSRLLLNPRSSSANPHSLFQPFVQRVWIALEEKGIPYEYKEVNPYKKEPHFLKINPKGLVPALG